MVVVGSKVAEPYAEALFDLSKISKNFKRNNK